jgi:pimeloyl-ACP methyl ester carboxylesterase
MYYEDQGQGDVIVFIHGLGGSHSSFELQKKELSKQFRCIVPDLRGYGDSDDTDTDYTFKELAKDIIDLLNKLDCKKANFVGISMGGMVTQRILIDYPEYVNKAVLSATAPCRQDEDKKINIDFIKEMNFDVHTIARWAGEQLFPGKGNELRRMKYIENYEKNRNDTFRKNYDEIHRFDHRKELKKCDTEVLVIHGIDDPLVDIHFGYLLAGLLKNFTMHVYQYAGHMPHTNRTKSFNNDIINFLKGD